MNKRIVSILISGLYLLFPGCEKLEEPLVLDHRFLHVSDVLEYCQGPCQSVLDWENKPIRVQGFITDVENDSILNEYKNNARFFLTDIRSGMFIEIHVDEDVDEIFQVLSGISRKDRVFIRGITESILANQGSECMKGVIVLLRDSSDINLNLE